MKVSVPIGPMALVRQRQHRQFPPLWLSEMKKHQLEHVLLMSAQLGPSQALLSVQLVRRLLYLNTWVHFANYSKAPVPIMDDQQVQGPSSNQRGPLRHLQEHLLEPHT